VGEQTFEPPSREIWHVGRGLDGRSLRASFGREEGKCGRGNGRATFLTGCARCGAA
jgi:hypothetical protein